MKKKLINEDMTPFQKKMFGLGRANNSGMAAMLVILREIKKNDKIK